MKLIHRNIDLSKDKDYVLERHCRINYECDSPWKREMPYNDYQSEWLGLPSQIYGFLDALTGSVTDDRTIAEIITDGFGNIVGYLWVP
ncbi:MAG: hypothetical protein LBN43_06220, partial [Oscillospiraceae bacterium]|nr:hypothetical protein [Oscillospiraceae bacterium]